MIPNIPPADKKNRCAWVQGGNHLYYTYHDHEWGVPVHEDTRHFEFLLLEGVQAGLSWATVLNKRENYRRAMAGFAPQLVACFSSKKIATLLQDGGLIRNRLKMQAAVINARCFLAIAEEFGSFDRYIWRFVNGTPLQGTIPPPAFSAESKALAKDLKQRGFKFVGKTIMYAYMQATGMVNDHQHDCFCRRLCAAPK